VRASSAIIVIATFVEACSPQPTQVVTSSDPGLVSVDNPPPGFPREYTYMDKGICLSVHESWTRGPDIAGRQTWTKVVDTLRPGAC